MNWKAIGGILTILGCSTFGFLVAGSYKRDEKYLRELQEALLFMTSELQYRLTPLPELITRTMEYTSGALWQVFSLLDQELVVQIAPNAEACMYLALESAPSVPPITGNMLRLLGRSLGKFDLNGQLSGLTLVKEACEENLQVLSANRVQRLRSCRTLGICTGIALAILLI